MARQSVTVALGGDGGDELFAGYDRFLATALAGRFDFIPPTLRAALARRVRSLAANGSPKSTIYRLGRFLDGLPLAPVPRYAGWLSVFDGPGKQALYSDDFAAQVASVDSLDVLAEAYRRSDATDFVEATLDADLQMFLPDDLLVKMDIASMACSLEVRSPLLDHRVVEFAARLPRRMKLRGLVQKHVLKRIMRGVLPRADPAPQEDGLRRADRSLAARRAARDGVRRSARSPCARTGLFPPRRAPPAARRALERAGVSSPPALEPAHARALAPHVHRFTPAQWTDVTGAGCGGGLTRACRCISTNDPK